MQFTIESYAIYFVVVFTASFLLMVGVGNFFMDRKVARLVAEYEADQAKNAKKEG